MQLFIVDTAVKYVATLSENSFFLSSSKTFHNLKKEEHFVLYYMIVTLFISVLNLVCSASGELLPLLHWNHFFHPSLFLICSLLLPL